LFVGGFDHQPNLDAVKFFCKVVLPLIHHDLPEVEFRIVGSNMPAEIWQLASSRIVPIGYREDLTDELINARVFIAPLRYGAGMKGKVGQSMAYGLPVVGTSIAAEGFGATTNEHLLIADDPSEFADHVVRVYNDRELWTSISERSHKFMRDNYSPESLQPAIANLFAAPR
jgi:glycosyltransferase involved in cell wall biosynthesis